MAAKAYIVPVVLTPRGYEPSVLDLARKLPGYRAGGALINNALGYCVHTVFADDFTDFESHPDVVSFGGTPQVKCSDYIKSLDVVALTTLDSKTAITQRATDIGIQKTLTFQTAGATLRDFMLKLEPAADDFLYEKITPEVKQTILDDFNRADGGLGSGWTTLEGADLVVASNQAKSTNIYTRQVATRSEASFPNDHYAQVDSAVSFHDGNSYGAPIVRGGSGPTYYWMQSDFRRRVAGVDSYIADIVGMWPTLDVVYTWKMDATGTTLTIYRDGVSKMSVTDSNIASGKPGIHIQTGDTAIPLDNFQSTDATAAGGFFARAYYDRGNVNV